MCEVWGSHHNASDCLILFTVFLPLQNVVVPLRRLDAGLLGAVGSPVECQEEKEVLDSRECEHERGGGGVVTVEDERLEIFML